jgi:hypothetical protein
MVRLRFVFAAQTGAAALHVHNTEDHQGDTETECGEVHMLLLSFLLFAVRDAVIGRQRVSSTGQRLSDVEVGGRQCKGTAGICQPKTIGIQRVFESVESRVPLTAHLTTSDDDGAAVAARL